MTDDAPKTEPSLEFTYVFDEEPQKVWKALTNPAYREQWLPDQVVLSVRREHYLEELELLMQEIEPPHQQSIVIFTLTPTQHGGTVFNVVHRRKNTIMAANDAMPVMQHAA